VTAHPNCNGAILGYAGKAAPIGQCTGGGGGELGNTGSALPLLFGTGGGGTARLSGGLFGARDDEPKGDCEPGLSAPPTWGAVPALAGGGGAIGIVVRTYLSGICVSPFGFVMLGEKVPLPDVPGSGGKGTVSACWLAENDPLLGRFPLTVSVPDLPAVSGLEKLLGFEAELGNMEASDLGKFAPGAEPVG
jgi:hypothetical protein